MANSGWDGPLSRRMETSSEYDVDRPKAAVCDIEQIIGRTSVGEQLREGGWTRLDKPVCNGGDATTQRPWQYPAGAANSNGKYNVAAELG